MASDRRGRGGRRARARHRPRAVLRADGEREGAEGVPRRAPGHRNRLAPRQASSRIRSSTPRSPPWCSATAIRSPTTSWCSASPATRSTSRTASPTGRAGRCRRRSSPMRCPTSPICATSITALVADLGRRGRADWVDEEMEVLTSPDTYRIEPEHAWQRLKTRVRKPKELAVLIEVAAWREREAQAPRRAALARAQGRGDRRHRRAGADHAGAARGAALAAEGLRALEMGRRHSRGGQARARARSQDAAAARAAEAGAERRAPPSNCSRCCCA